MIILKSAWIFIHALLLFLLSRFPLFFVQTSAPSSSGHKPTQLCGKERHFAVPSYARRSWIGASAFLCPDFNGQLLGLKLLLLCGKHAASEAQLKSAGAERPFPLFLFTVFLTD